MKTMAKKLVEVMKECSYIEKNGMNSFHKYPYTTCADVLAKVNGSFVRHGIASLAVPSLLDVTDVITAKGNTEKLATVQMTITLVDVETGETAEIVGIGSGQDSGDKAVMKAETAAIKYAYLLSLAISTGDDPEADRKTDRTASTPEPVARQTIPAEGPDRQTPVRTKRVQPVNRCADCGAVISDKVWEYSVKQYGRPLCMRCQHNTRETA